MRKIKIKKTNNPDYGYTNPEELYSETTQHQQDVCRVMYELAKIIMKRGEIHDWTKKKYFQDFANDTLERLDTPDFKSREWYKTHTTLERHHINANVPDDVNLIDILECICDCICAGKSRSGEVNPSFLVLKEGILEKAYWNTVNKISNNVILED